VVDWENTGSILSQLHHIHDRVTGLNTHSFADLAKLQREGERLFHSLLVFENYPLPKEEALDVDAIAINFRDAVEKVDYPLGITASEHDGRLVITLRYDGKYMTEERAEDHIKTMERIIGYVREDVGLPHDQICLLQPAEYQQVIYNWNQTDKEYKEGKTIQELFEEQAGRAPENVALVFKGEQLTYRELNEKSNQLAYHIRNQYRQKTGEELRANTLIALCLDRSLEMIVGILGVLKAGGTYIPIDPGYPKERVEYILDDTGAAVIVSQKHVTELAKVQLPEDKVVLIDLSDACYTNQNTSNLRLQNKSTDLAYVIYTSGTTGKPKGVMVEHHQVASFAVDNNFIDYENVTVVGGISSYVFDGSVFDIFFSLLNGKQLILIDKNDLQDSYRLDSELTNNNVDTIFITTALFNALAVNKATCLDGLKQILFGGEACSVEIVNTFKSRYKATSLIHVYGPTENIVYSSYCKLNEYNTTRVVPIGAHLSDKKLYVLNRSLNPVPVGVSGELYIGGAGVARGYLNNEILTKERFLTNPFATDADKQLGHTRLYKTGDLVRWLSDGNVEFIGRNDDQVKIRGYRIELGEIEHMLRQIPGIKQSCVVARVRETASGQSKYLVGYYVLEKGIQNASESDILNKLSVALPEYMVPSALVSLESLPLTINGKLDKRALPDPDTLNKETYATPVTETETALATVWAEVLRLKQVSIEDNFFRIGGDSILAMQLSARIQKLGYNCQVKDILSNKTISKLSAYLDSNTVRVEIQSEQGLLTGGLGLLPIQQWFADQVAEGRLGAPHHWNQSFMIRVPEMEEEKLLSMIRELISYHDIFRVRYEQGSDVLKQYYTQDVSMPTIKRLQISGQHEGSLTTTLTQWQSSFDLKNGPLYQVGYLHGYEDGSARIYVAMHHLIVDAVSWRILAEDLKCLYEGKKLQPKGSSYRQWAACLSTYPGKHKNELQYWSGQLKGLPTYAAGELQEPSEGHVELSERLTQLLLQEAPAAYHTEINDLLLTSLAYALRELNNQEVQGITLEGHGREPIDPAIDHSHTVGWYTSMYPVRLELGTTIGKSITKIKEGLRSIPNKGVGFGAFAVRAVGYGFSDLPPISFNYLGQFSAGDEEDWQIAPESSGQSTSPLNKDYHLININGRVSEGKLLFDVMTRLGITQTEKLAERFTNHLTNVIEHCLDQPGREELYPASHLQLYWYKIYKNGLKHAAHGVITRTLHNVNEEQFKEAMRMLVLRHESLRTTFTEQNGKLFQRISPPKNSKSIVLVEDVTGDSKGAEKIQILMNEMTTYSFDYEKEYPCKCKLIKYEENSYKVIIVIDHIIHDGMATRIVEEELFKIYDACSTGKSSPLAPLKLQFRDYVSYQDEHYSGKKLAFHQAWVKKIFKNLPSRIQFKSMYSSTNVTENGSKNLDNQLNSERPNGGRYVFMLSEEILKEIQRVSADMGISTYNFLLASYGIFLNRICVQNDFVIDSPTSGRNNEDFSKIVGCLAATLSLRINVNTDTSFRAFALSCNDLILEAMDHIHFHNDAFNLGVEWSHIATQLNLTSDPDKTIENFQPYHYDMEFTYFDFMCLAQEVKNGMTVRFAYKRNILDESLITEIADVFVDVIKMAIQAPDSQLKDWKEVDDVIDQKIR
jgi:amino acid adenylation domain-containing protein/non-ribosomal peptide synthase protein (TIGR01720 family)